MPAANRLRNQLAAEIRNAARMMEKATAPQQKLYFFSAAFSYCNRFINFEYDPKIHVADALLSISFTKVNERFAAIAAGDMSMPELPTNLFENLVTGLDELADEIQREGDVMPALERIWKNAYATTGNGYYLWKKGDMKIS